LDPFPPQLRTDPLETGRVASVARSAASAKSERSQGLFSWLFNADPEVSTTANAASASNVNHSLVSSMIAKMPAAEDLCEASEMQLKDLLDRVGPNASSVLRFLLASCPLALHTLERPEHQLPIVRGPGVLQLAVLQAAPAQETIFRGGSQAFGTRFGFHGSPLRNWYSIMRNGLQILSNTELMGSGARFGAGIYLADRVSTAQHYCGGFAGSRYSAHAGEALQILAIVEYINDPAVHQRHSEGIITVTDSAAVMLRYLLVYSLSSHVSVDKLDEEEVRRRWSLLTRMLKAEASKN